MKGWQSFLGALFVGGLLTLAPIDSNYTGGIFGAQPLCAQESPTEACLDAWEDLVLAADRHCAEGLVAFCQVACDPETGALLQSLCACVVPPDEEGEGDGNG